MKTRKLTGALVLSILSILMLVLSMTNCASSQQRGEDVPVPVLGTPNLLQTALNLLPPVSVPTSMLPLPIKLPDVQVQFQFGGNTWVAKLNNKDTLTGTITFQNTEEGVILTLRQTHMKPLGKWVETSGAEIFLEYKAGPPVSISVLSGSNAAEKIAAAQEAGFESGGDSSSDNISESTVSVTSASRQEPVRSQPTRTSANAKDNWISGELGLGLWGAGISYERMLNSKLSLGVNFLWYPMLVHSWNAPFVEESAFLLNATFRFYPGGNIFFVGTGFGGVVSDFDFKHPDAFVFNRDVFGLVVTPEIGVKADAGKEGGLYVQSGIKGSIMFSGSDVTFGGMTFFGMGYMW